MSAPYTTRSEIAAEVNQFYDRVLLERALPNLVHGVFGQTRNIPANAGSAIIAFRRYTSLAVAGTLTESTTPTGKSLAQTTITATALQYGDFTVISDVVQVQTVDPILTETSDLFGEQMGNTLDQAGRDILVAGTVIQYPSTAVSRVTVAATMVPTVADFLKITRTLKVANARKITRIAPGSPNIGTIPVNAAYVGIVHPQITYTLPAMTAVGDIKYVPVESYAANVGQLMPGEVGKVGEIRFCESTNAKVFTGGGASSIDVYATLVLGANAYGTIDLANSQSQGVIYQGLGSAGSADPLNQRQSLGWKAYYIAKILNDAFMARYETAIV